MSEKKYKIEPMDDGSLTDLERANALNLEWSRLERPLRLYPKHSGNTVGFPIGLNQSNDVIMTVDTSGNRKFWNVHSDLIESDLDTLKELLDQDMNTGQWNGYKNSILNGSSGKVNANQVIPNSWNELK